jgi:hypothetical protein
MLSAKRLVTPSVALPAGNGTINVIRLEGNGCARTSDSVPAPMIAATRSHRIFHSDTAPKNCHGSVKMPRDTNPLASIRCLVSAPNQSA